MTGPRRRFDNNNVNNKLEQKILEDLFELYLNNVSISRPIAILLEMRDTKSLITIFN